MVYRWIFTDPATGATWTMSRNPSEMTSPIPPRPITAVGTTAGSMIAYEGVPQPFQWTFKGYVLNQADYTNLMGWFTRQNRFTITDHYGRVFTVVPVNFAPVPKTTPTRYWRQDYEFTVITLAYDDSGIVGDLWGS